RAARARDGRGLGEQPGGQRDPRHRPVRGEAHAGRVARGARAAGADRLSRGGGDDHPRQSRHADARPPRRRRRDIRRAGGPGARVTFEVILLALASTIRPTSLAAVYTLLSSPAPRRLMIAYVIAGLTFTIAFGALVVWAFHGIA